ncbi:histidinol dehydrogenase [Chloroflexota bacterium]
MKIIKGFSQAKAALSREGKEYSFAVSPALKESLQKLFGTNDPEQAVRQIVRDVKKGGDDAILEITLRIDGIKLDSLEVAEGEIADAYRKVDSELVAALKLAAGRIQSFHEAQKASVWHEVSVKGLSQLICPLQRVGVYVPGGNASYPSTVLMTAIPAKVAGVSEVVMVTPPTKNGSISPMVLVAADIARVDRIFCVGGAQAVAALAYGTESVPAVDKICGPGNIFVTLAKKEVFGVVDIDGLQGPSEVLIIADEKANPENCAADILAQAEHDTLASAILITTSQQMADEINREVARQLSGLSRQSIASESLDRGLIAVVASLEEAIELSNLYAPEHLCLMVEDAAACIDKITNAGCIVAGREATVVLGDYVAGPSHALPTGGTARFSSPLNISDFIKFTSVIYTEQLDIKQLGKAASTIARAEGLNAHARAIENKLKDSG